MLVHGWCRTELGGDSAYNDVSSVLPGALIPAMLENESFEGPKGIMFIAQDYADIKLQ
jgi:hypothetical protein